MSASASIRQRSRRQSRYVSATIGKSGGCASSAAGRAPSGAAARTASASPTGCAAGGARAGRSRGSARPKSAVFRGGRRGSARSASAAVIRAGALERDLALARGSASGFPRPPRRSRRPLPSPRAGGSPARPTRGGSPRARRRSARRGRDPRARSGTSRRSRARPKPGRPGPPLRAGQSRRGRPRPLRAAGPLVERREDSRVVEVLRDEALQPSDPGAQLGVRPIPSPRQKGISRVRREPPRRRPARA